MELGERIYRERTAAGLSQRQLCGEQITRNMLSQIENGAARPSLDTLRYLAQRLGKPVSYFLQEAALPNQQLMQQLRQATPEQALQLLPEYQGPDPEFDRECKLLEASACILLAEQAIENGKTGYARSLLDRAKAAGGETPYYTQEMERRRLLLCHRAGESAKEIVDGLPDIGQELLLRAQAALQNGDSQSCMAYLQAIQNRDSVYYEWTGYALEQQGQYEKAVAAYLQCGDLPRLYSHLENCYQKLGNYEQAYAYACKQRK